MARKNQSTTRLEIIRIGTRLFLENGFSATSAPRIARELGISTGNLTFHFPTKEDLLAVLVDELCNFQWQMMEQAVEEGKSSLLALCLETTAIIAICEENEQAKDFYLSAYTHSKTLEIIRRNDMQKAKEVFGVYCTDWDEAVFAEAENLVSGIEYAALMKTNDAVPMDIRIAGALNSIMLIYNVPEELREKKIQKVLAMDYRAIGRRILKEFHTYILETNEQALKSAAGRSQ